MSGESKEKVAAGLRITNTALLGIIGFFLVSFYTEVKETNNNQNDRLNDLVLKYEVVKTVQQYLTENCNNNTDDLKKMQDYLLRKLQMPAQPTAKDQ